MAKISPDGPQKKLARNGTTDGESDAGFSRLEFDRQPKPLYVAERLHSGDGEAARIFRLAA
jgi:hypothetical protein